jgi:hypothetical protein
VAISVLGNNVLAAAYGSAEFWVCNILTSCGAHFARRPAGKALRNHRAHTKYPTFMRHLCAIRKRQSAHFVITKLRSQDVVFQNVENWALIELNPLSGIFCAKGEGGRGGGTKSYRGADLARLNTLRENAVDNCCSCQGIDFSRAEPGLL